MGTQACQLQRDRVLRDAAFMTVTMDCVTMSGVIVSVAIAACDSSCRQLVDLQPRSSLVRGLQPMRTLKLTSYFGG